MKTTMTTTTKTMTTTTTMADDYAKNSDKADKADKADQADKADKADKAKTSTLIGTSGWATKLTTVVMEQRNMTVRRDVTQQPAGTNKEGGAKDGHVRQAT